MGKVMSISGTLINRIEKLIRCKLPLITIFPSHASLDNYKPPIPLYTKPKHYYEERYVKLHRLNDVLIKVTLRTCKSIDSDLFMELDGWSYDIYKELIEVCEILNNWKDSPYWSC
jgi:hypothetical protein